MKTAMYLRKSRAEENESVETTLSRHKETLNEFALKHGLEIARVYEEVVSGDSLFGRPAMLELLRDIGDGCFDAVLCMDIDRLGRGNMKEQGIVLETVKNVAC
jgi:DNA invertase Pin-like site-specific DNA recombinase